MARRRERLDVTAYWQEPPPEPSPGLRKWLVRVEGGFRRNGRLGGMGYHESAEFFNVYVWEYLNVLQPAFWATEGLAP